MYLMEKGFEDYVMLNINEEEYIKVTEWQQRVQKVYNVLLRI